jgi:RNA polymerase sigma factor (sigma-70 family)
MDLMLEPTDLEFFDAGDLEGLVQRHYGGVYGLARKLLGSEADARDVAQETFARALANLRTFDTRRPFRPWILAIAAHLTRDLLRKRRELRLAPEAEEELADPDLPLEPLFRREEREQILAALERLPFDWKLVVVLHFQQDLPPAEIAVMLGITPNAVQIRLYRALEALRKELS